jgi:membrane protease YdiL (CAAX protease family)
VRDSCADLTRAFATGLWSFGRFATGLDFLDTLFFYDIENQMDALITSVVFAAIAFVIFSAAKIADKRILLAFALLAAVYIGLDDLVTGLPSVVKGVDLVPGKWNWTGKVFSLVLSALVIAALKHSPKTIGLTLKQEYPWLGFIAVLFFIVWGASLGLLFKPGAPDAETLAFQALMPALSEEIVYRGIAPALLLGLIYRKEPIDGIPWAVVISTAIVFGIWHGLKYSGGSFEFDSMSALFPFIGSIIGGWLRFKTKSLLVPVLGHSFANVAFHVAGGIGG